MLKSVILFAIGLVLLIKGGDWFVDGATGIAKRFKLPDIVVGATVVSIGTTLPEVMVSTTGALAGSGAMAYGNAIGSIICNTSLIAAISIAVNPGPVNVKSMKMPVLFFFASSAIYCLAAYILGTFPRWMGFLMLTVFVVYTIMTVRNGLRNPDANTEDEEDEESKPRTLWMELLLLVAGAAVLSERNMAIEFETRGCPADVPLCFPICKCPPGAVHILQQEGIFFYPFLYLSLFSFSSAQTGTKPLRR